MRCTVLSTALLASAFLSFPCKAEREDIMESLYASDFWEKTEEETKQGITMEGQLGLSLTSGNTKGTSINARLTTEQESENWSNRYVLEGLYTRTENVGVDTEAQTTAQRFNATIEADYKLSNPNNRIFLFSDYENNRFSNFDYQASFAAGWASLQWKTEESSFRYSIGPGYNISRRTEVEHASNSQISGQNQNGPIVRASLEYAYEWGTGARMKQIISTWIGNDNTRSRAETSVSAKIIDALAMKLSLRLDHNTSPTLNNSALDTETSLAVVYQFF